MYFHTLGLYLFFNVICSINNTYYIDAETVVDNNRPIKTILENALPTVKSAIQKIFIDWQVDKYPNFLKSCYMQKVFT